jgi:hypothetical protein
VVNWVSYHVPFFLSACGACCYIYFHCSYLYNYYNYSRTVCIKCILRFSKISLLCRGDRGETESDFMDKSNVLCRSRKLGICCLWDSVTSLTNPFCLSYFECLYSFNLQWTVEIYAKMVCTWTVLFERILGNLKCKSDSTKSEKERALESANLYETFLQECDHEYRNHDNPWKRTS